MKLISQTLKTKKMKTLKKTVYVALLAFITVMAGCSKSDDNRSEETGNSETLGNYNITIDGQRYSGEVGLVNDDDNQGAVGLATFQEEGGKTIVGFALMNNDISSTGGFEYPNGQSNNVSLDESGESSIGFMLTVNPNTAYTSKSGTAKVIVGEKLGVGDGSGYVIALQVEFQGTFYFQEANEDERMVQVSGTFNINLPRVH